MPDLDDLCGHALARALRDGAVAEALARELAPLEGTHAAVAGKVGATLHAIDGRVEEIEARHLARDVALLVQASLLRRHAPEPLFDAFCRSRFGHDGSEVFGLLRAGTDFDTIIARAMPRELS